jgi:single-stranded-DNA-specific exonuclease
VPSRRYDAKVHSDDLVPQLYAELDRLGPWGMGNPRPTWVVPGVVVQGLRKIGAAGDHLKFRLPQSNGRNIDAIWFGAGQHAAALDGARVDLMGTIGENTWRGRTTLQFEVRDARLAED